MEVEINEMAKELHCATNESYISCRAIARILVARRGFCRAEVVRKDTAEDILRLVDENEFNVGEALYHQSITDEADVVNPIGLRRAIAQKYGVEIEK